ncbi:hypothetical protein H5410_013615 [Solanum commersonii]|uniref:Uncharacterized protein n=1 Tax=Solanum commersonii TaxID=4109 RepID=A0A9J5ZNY9_SOLCO|nr:hypothetical protein H5410_013615 [Solanum commersonii]
MARARYPWLAEIPNTWPDIVEFLESYTPLISTIVIRWKCPERGRYKCNSDGSCQVNYGLCSKAFCIRDGRGIPGIVGIEAKLGAEEVFNGVEFMAVVRLVTAKVILDQALESIIRHRQSG